MENDHRATTTSHTLWHMEETIYCNGHGGGEEDKGKLDEDNGICFGRHE